MNPLMDCGSTVLSTAPTVSPFVRTDPNEILRCLVSLKDVRVLAYERVGPDAWLLIEQDLAKPCCPGCGQRAFVKERPVVQYVDLPVFGMPMRESQSFERSYAGPLWQDRGLVFTRPTGEPIWQSDANRYLAKMCKKAGVPKVTMHQLRHTTPSILLRLGVDQRVIMRVLRHSTIVLTADLYTHVVDSLVEEALDQIDDAFGDR